MQEIVFLKECKEFLPVIAGWCNKEWPSDYDNGNLEKAIEFFSQLINHTEEFPLCLVAINNHQPVGTISILRDDMNIRNYSPWIGNLFIEKNHRAQFLAQKLIKEALNVSKKIGIQEIYAWSTSLDNMARRLGFLEIDTVEYLNKNTKIFKKEI